MAQEIIWHAIDLTLARDTGTGVVTVVGPPEAVTRRTLDQKVRDAVVKGGTLDVSLGTTADVAPALTNAAIKVASLRSLGKLSNADTAANAGPILQRLITIMIDLALIDKRAGKLAVQLFDES